MEIFEWRTFSSHENRSTASSNISDTTCSPDQQSYTIVWSALVWLSCTLSIPSCIAILRELTRRCSSLPSKGASTNASSSSSDILLFNLMLIFIIGIFYALSHSLIVLGVDLPPWVLKVCFIAHMGGGPFAALANSLDCYLAVVHPVMYLTAKRSWRFPVVLGTLNWVYIVAMEVIIIANDMKMYSFVILFPAYVLFPPYLFLNISTLCALRSAGPKRRRLADLSATKRRAFWQILTILVGNLFYTFPFFVLLTYQALCNVDGQTFFCVMIPMVMVIPVVSGTLLTLIILFSMKPCVICKRSSLV